ncbi:MAG TPA: hypothetical protein VKU92_11275 [Acidimicrobiales bacterium]|nr:hypothetical protein [Acidimicrobiales bacterium]
MGTVVVTATEIDVPSGGSSDQSTERDPDLLGTLEVELSARSPRRWRRVAAGLGATAFFLLVGFLCYWPDSPIASGRIVTRPTSDLAQGLWFVEWFAFALTHGLNPFYTHYLLAPKGANLALDNTAPLLSLLVMPVTLLAGPLAAFNLLFRLGVGLSGASTYFMLRRYTSWWPAAALGGLVFELSPYLMGHAHRHDFLTFVVFVPMLVLLVDDWLWSCRRGPVASGLLVGLVAALQFLVSVEVLAGTAVVLAGTVAVLAARHRQAVRSRLARLWKGGLAAGGLFLVLTGYPLWMLLYGPQRPAAGLHDLSNLAHYHGDLLAPLFPSSFTWWHFSNVAQRFVYASRVEDGFYLGAPLIVLLGCLAIRFRRDRVVAIGALVAIAAFVLGLGPRLYVDGKDLHVPLPFALLTHLPLLRNLEPARMTLFMWLGAVTVLAVGLDRLRAAGWRWRSPAATERGRHLRSASPGAWPRALLACVAVAVALAPVMPRLPIASKRVGAPPFFVTSRDLRLVPTGALVLTFPYNLAPYDAPMVWQVTSRMRYRILGGEATVPGPEGVALSHQRPQAPAPLATLLVSSWRNSHGQWDLHPPDGPELVPMLRSYLRREGVDDVLVVQKALHSVLVARIVTEALGSSPLVVGRVDVWLHVRSALDGRHPDRRS